MATNDSNLTSLNLSSTITQLRGQMQSGAITPAQAQSQLNAAIQQSATRANGIVGVDQTAVNNAISQLFAPMTINKDGQILQLNSNGTVTQQSTAIHQATTTGAGTTASTSYSTPGMNGSYTVKSGDTLSQIASQNGMTTQQLLALNPQFQSNPNLINPGQTVNLGTSGQTAVPQAQNTTSSSTGAQGGIPVPTPTGNPTLDAAQEQQYQYVTGSLAAGYTLNPALSGTNLAAMLPQFMQETASQLEPELLQNLQTEMVGINNSLNSLTADYTAKQGQTIQDFQQSLGTLRDQSSMTGGGERALELGLTNTANRTLSNLDTQFGTNVSGVLNQGGAAIGPGAFEGILSATGGAPTSLAGFNAYGINAPNVQSQTVSNQGGDSVFAGSSGAGRSLNFNYDPSMYTYGSIPSNFGQNFGTTLNQLFSNYQAGTVATPTTAKNSYAGLTG